MKTNYDIDSVPSDISLKLPVTKNEAMQIFDAYNISFVREIHASEIPDIVRNRYDEVNASGPSQASLVGYLVIDDVIIEDKKIGDAIAKSRGSKTKFIVIGEIKDPYVNMNLSTLRAI